MTLFPVLGVEFTPCTVCFPQKEEAAEKQENNHTAAAVVHSSGGICRRCLHFAKYLVIILIIPPFLNYTALQQEGNVLMSDGTM